MEIKEIEDLKWWDLPESELEKIKPLFFKDLLKRESIYE
jgi:virginiamycin A acetyltransferase